MTGSFQHRSDGAYLENSASGAEFSRRIADFLPRSLPASVSRAFLELAQIDLDEPCWAADNDATVRAFWDAAAGRIGRSVRFSERRTQPGLGKHRTG